jgi:hypothetical protein
MSKPLINALAELTASEAHALETHFRDACEASYRAHGITETVQEIADLGGYLASLRRNTFGNGRGALPAKPRIDSAVATHEAVFHVLTPSEREAFAVHMDAAQSEYRSAGGSAAMLSELATTAHDAGYAASSAGVTDYAPPTVKAYAATPLRKR